MTDAKSLDAAALYSGPVTFMNVPQATDATGAGAAILGCPFDCGTHPFRVGARQGPQAIRDQSGLVRRFQSEYADYDALERLGVVDCGDVRLTPSRIEEAFERIEEAAYRIAAAGAVPVGFGGDGSVSLPLVRAAARAHPGLAVLHVDSHTDAYPVDPVHRFDAATQFTHAALEQRASASSSFHVGLRGSTTRPGVYDHGRSLGYNLVTMQEFWQRGPADVLDEIVAKVGRRPLYLSWDMDVFDPSCAPGVCTPIWGGFSAREGLDLLRSLSGLNIVAADVNTVSPPQDINGMTAFLAAAVTYEILLLIEGRTSRDSVAPS
jgi:agmatinase